MTASLLQLKRAFGEVPGSLQGIAYVQQRGILDVQYYQALSNKQTSERERQI
jgi:hypothetical protein